MNKRLRLLVLIWHLIRRPFLLLVSLLVIFLFFAHILSLSRVVGDSASHLLLAVSPILKIGSPYKNFWDIKPPMLPSVLYIWSNIFGFGFLSIRIFSIIMEVLLVVLIYLLYKKLFKTPVFEFIYLSTVLILLSSNLNTLMISTENLGLLFSIAGLLMLLKTGNGFTKFIFAGFLFFASSQSKEPYSLTIISTIPLLIKPLVQKRIGIFFKNTCTIILGVLLCLTVIVFYLGLLGSLNNYLEVLKFKQIFFPLTFDRLWMNLLPAIFASEHAFIEFSKGISLSIIIVLASFLLTNKFKKSLAIDSKKYTIKVNSFIISDSSNISKYVVLFYSIGSFLGFGLGATFGSHYLIQVVVPFYLIAGLSISYLFNNSVFLLHKSKRYFFISLILLLLSTVIFLPKRPYFSSYLIKNIKLNSEDSIHGSEKRITELTTQDQCVLIVYGWGNGENYLYSRRRPCTRFFLPNIVVFDWQKTEYKKSILENPPAAVIYHTEQSDMDTTKFEKEVINLNKILRNCYVKDSKEVTVYIPKTGDTESLKKCLNANSS